MHFTKQMQNPACNQGEATILFRVVGLTFYVLAKYPLSMYIRVYIFILWKTKDVALKYV